MTVANPTEVVLRAHRTDVSQPPSSLLEVRPARVRELGEGEVLVENLFQQIVAVNALNDEQAATLHAELLAIYNSNHAQPAPAPSPEAEVEIIDDGQAPIFDYGDDTDPNGGAA